ncbi:MAG: hypothetical protein MUC88_16735 [Planctomycetes bacterium]|jgi:hypothetical protein|nr:hypothetical protein [Planctomycetota bacterium]
MNLLLATLILLAGATGTSSSDSAQIYGSPGLVVSNTVGVSTPRLPQNGVSMVYDDGLPGQFALPEQGHDNVLVVPAPDLPAESVAELTEDMTIMCRIFDKSVPLSRPGTTIGLAYGERNDIFRYAFGEQTGAAQGLYLDGYGALFFLRVDYPLLPPEPAPPQPAEPVDSVWSQTIREMTGQQNDDTQDTRGAPAYDAQRVESLKKTLIQTLAHAGNIRVRRPQDFVTLVVGPLDDGRAYGYSRSPRTRFGSMSSAGRGAVGGSTSGRRAADDLSTAPALMVLRTAKADIDAFARGRLTVAQFTEKVQILWSGPCASERTEPQGRPPAATTAPVTPR